MMDFDQRQLVTNALPLIAIVLMASGILVKTLPLESKRPSDAEQVKISHAGRQDVEARLWRDPFVAMRDVEGKTPTERCGNAIEDEAHHPSTLTESLRYRQMRRQDKVAVLPVVVPGGPYFEDGESRRRIRYATVMALFKMGWVPLAEDKLGFVWTFESCVEAPWARRIPELLPYEWFRREDKDEWLLMLWIDEDAITRSPLRSMEYLTELIANGGVSCPLDSAGQDRKGGSRWRDSLAQRLAKECVCVAAPSSTAPHNEAARKNQAPKRIGGVKEQTPVVVNPPQSKNENPGVDQEYGTKSCRTRTVRPLPRISGPLPWERMPVIGPWTSTALHGLITELARNVVRNGPSRDNNSESHSTRRLVRFYSASATAAINDQNFCSAIDEACERQRQRASSGVELEPCINGGVSATGSYITQAVEDACLAVASCPSPLSNELEDALRELKAPLEEALNARLVRLTTTDDQHTKALVGEIQRRLVDSTPYSLLSPLGGGDEALCNGTIVIVAEGDTAYARAFREEFSKELGEKCEEKGINVQQVSYLRGLDGASPRGDGAAQAAATQPTNGKLRPNEILLEQAALERADGPSQYDYLRRLATRIEDLDRSEREAGQHGISAIGVLGNDTYDKMLVLDALRDRFRDTVFFAADLDARLLAAGANRTTRNLVLASGFGLSLQPALQGSAPPFRDTYQTGTFLAVQVALDPEAHELDTEDFAHWFLEPRMFEIGRTRPVNLIPPIWTGPAFDECNPLMMRQCCLAGIHADADWRAFDPRPGGPALIASIAMTLAAAALAFLLSERVRRAVRATWDNRPLGSAGGLVVSIILFSAALYYIYEDVRSPDGEPFAWLEGVSIWPTQILRLIIFFLTLALLYYGRRRLRTNINSLAETFRLVKIQDREGTARSLPEAGLWKRVKWLWWLDDRESRVDGKSPKLDDPWQEYVERIRFGPSVLRIAVTTTLFFLFGVALMSLDWPNSPHRGADAALFNHGLQLILLGAVMALLFATFDASEMAARLLRYLARLDRLAVEPFVSGVTERYPVGEDVTRLFNRFHLAVRLSSSVNQLIYMPLLSVLLLLPARSRLFDAWDFPLSYAALLVVATLLALGCAMRLRRVARELRENVLREVNRQAGELELEAKRTSGAPVESGTSPPDFQAELLRRIATEIREVREGAFRPLLQEPVIRGILLVLGGTGGVTTAEFLLLSGG